MNYIDVIVIVFVAFTCFHGYQKGFIKTLFDTVGIIIAFFLSKESYYIVEEFLLNNTKIFVKVHDFFEIKALTFSEILYDNSDNIIKSFKETLKLPVELQSMVSNIFNSSSTSNVDSFSIFVDNMSIIAIRSLSFVFTFLIIYTILIIVSNFINAIFKLPLLNITNRLFGAATGMLKSVIILYIIFALSSPLVGFLQDNKLVEGILDSESSKIFYDNNIILNYLSYKGFYEN